MKQSLLLPYTGYPLQDKDIQDLRLLHERFGVDYPPEHAGLIILAHALGHAELFGRQVLALLVLGLGPAQPQGDGHWHAYR